MKKIVYVYSNLPAYRKVFFIGLDKKLRQEEIDLTVMYGTLSDDKVVQQDNDGTYHKSPHKSVNHKLGPFRLTSINGFKDDYKRINPDAMVISYMTTQLSLLWAVLYCLIRRIPYATWRCGYSRDGKGVLFNFRMWMIKFVEKRAKYNIAYGSYYKNVLIKKGIDSDKIVIAQNTINVETIVEDNKDLRKDFLGSTTNILFVGALIPEKNLKSSIDAVGELINNGYSVSFDIVGGGVILEEIRGYIHSLNLEQYIHVVGPKYGEDVRQFFRNADVFLAAGLGGLAINEAMAYGLPIISTNADWTICDLIDGNGYFMDKYGDKDLQYHYLTDFISLSPEQKRIMSDRSKEIILTRASLANMISKHNEVCLKLIDSDLSPFNNPNAN